MPSSYSHPFDCPQCDQQPPEAFERFTPVDDWMIFYPELKQIHMHFGNSTDSEKLHTEETAWILDVQKRNMPKYPGITFCVLADMRRADDSEYPSEESKKMYKEILSHPQMGDTIFYGMAPGMSFFLNILAKIVSGRIHAVHTREDADKLYQAWLAKQAK